MCLQSAWMREEYQALEAYPSYALSWTLITRKMSWKAPEEQKDSLQRKQLHDINSTYVLMRTGTTFDRAEALEQWKQLSNFFRKKAASNVLAKTTKNEQSEQLLFSPACTFKCSFKTGEWLKNIACWAQLCSASMYLYTFFKIIDIHGSRKCVYNTV